MTSAMVSYHVDILQSTYDNILISSSSRDRKRRVEDSCKADRMELEELYVEDDTCENDCPANNETLSKMVSYLQCKGDTDVSSHRDRDIHMPSTNMYVDSEDDDTSSTASSRSTSSFKKSRTFKDLVLLENTYMLESIDTSMGALYM